MFKAWKSFWRIFDVVCDKGEKVIIIVLEGLAEILSNFMGTGVNASRSLLQNSIDNQKTMAED